MDPDGDQVYFYDGAYETILTFPLGGERARPFHSPGGQMAVPGQAVHQPGRQDEPGQAVRNLPGLGEPARRIHHLGRHDEVRMELLPGGILLFSGLRTHNVYAFARYGTSLLGSQGDPPVNILGQDRFELVTDLAVGPGGERVYVIDHDGFVQGFEWARQGAGLPISPAQPAR